VELDIPAKVAFCIKAGVSFFQFQIKSSQIFDEAFLDDSGALSIFPCVCDLDELVGRAAGF
jgi:hypothetical protein